MLDKHDLLSIALLVYRAGEFDTPTVTTLPSFSPPNSADYTGANVNFDKIINAADGTRAKGEIGRQREREREGEKETSYTPIDVCRKGETGKFTGRMHPRWPGNFLAVKRNIETP